MSAAGKARAPLANVRGKTAFITGGSSGIGLGIARSCAAAGMNVVFTYRHEAHRDAALASFAPTHAAVYAIKMDTTDRDAFARAANEAQSVFGNVHLLVNNAGVGVSMPVSQCSHQDWDWAMEVNVTGVFNGIHVFLPHMLAHGEGGHLVTTSSSGGLVAGTLGVYCTTKFAVVGLMESLRVELADTPIGVSVFCPGLVQSQIGDVDRNRPASHGMQTATAPAFGKSGEPPMGLQAHAMDPLTAGEKVLAGVRNNDLYILSHPEFSDVVRERYEAMAASFDTDPVPPDRAAITQTFLPDIYRVEAAKKRGH